MTTFTKIKAFLAACLSLKDDISGTKIECFALANDKVKRFFCFLEYFYR